MVVDFAAAGVGESEPEVDAAVARIGLAGGGVGCSKKTAAY